MGNSQVCNYADDSSLTVAYVDSDKIIGRLKTNIDILDRWFKNNGMLLNEDKCHFMIIEPTWNTRQIKERIKFRKQTIKETNKANLLGITFDNKLTVNYHIKILFEYLCIFENDEILSEQDEILSEYFPFLYI